MKKVKNIIIIILIIFQIVNVCFPQNVFATGDSLNEEEDWGINLGGIVDDLLGILVYPWKLTFLIPGIVVELVLMDVAAIGTRSTVETVTIEDILFNRIRLTDVNVFEDRFDASNEIKEIRQNVANWYFAFRNLSIVISLVVLIYIGIKMTLNNIASEKAKYKKMLFDWLVGFALIFILHFIIIIVLEINTTIVNSLYKEVLVDGKNFTDRLYVQAFGISLTKSWGATIIYSILLVITFMFLLKYIKRMLMVCFLIIIAPLITMLYSIDKSGNNRSETLNTWLKEFCYNVLIQPFHCIIYYAFVGTAMNIMYTGNESLFINKNGFAIGDMFFAIVCILCIFMGEKIIRVIFGFNKSKSVAEKIFKGAIIKNAINDVKRIKSISEDEEEEQTAMPSLMSGGMNTNEVLVNRKNNIPIPDIVQQSEEEQTQEEKTPEKANSKGTKPKQTKKILLPVKDLGKAYARGASSAIGISKVKEFKRKAQKKKMPSAKEAFLIQSEIYRQVVNPNMSNEELAKQTEAIMQSSVSDLTNVNDIIYKEWIEFAQKNDVAKTPEEIKNTILQSKKTSKVEKQEKKVVKTKRGKV